MKDGSKSTNVGSAEETANHLEIANQRKLSLQVAAANLFAESLILCNDQPVDLQDQLILAQEKYFSDFSNTIPVTLHPLSLAVREELKKINTPTQKILLISNHPPYEKAVSPTAKQLIHALNLYGHNEIVSTLQNMENLPAGIARRAVINQVLKTIYPEKHFQYHVVGAKYRPPLHIVQENDGTIIVPYAEKGTGGFEMLTNGLRQTLASDENTYPRIPVVVAFPEGEHPQTIEQLKPFHSGIFAASASISKEIGISISILPLVIAVKDDFSVYVKILEPIQITPALAQKAIAQEFTISLQKEMQTAYTDLLQSFSGYFWRGMTYPFGGISRQKILEITEKSDHR